MKIRLFTTRIIEIIIKGSRSIGQHLAAMHTYTLILLIIIYNTKFCDMLWGMSSRLHLEFLSIKFVFQVYFNLGFVYAVSLCNFYLVELPTCIG